MIDVLYNKLGSINDSRLAEWKDIDISIYNRHSQTSAMSLASHSPLLKEMKPAKPVESAKPVKFPKVPDSITLEPLPLKQSSVPQVPLASSSPLVSSSPLASQAPLASQVPLASPSPQASLLTLPVLSKKIDGSNGCNGCNECNGCVGTIDKGKREKRDKKDTTIKPLDVIMKEAMSFNISKEYIKDSIITLISKEEFSKVFGLTKCAEIMSGVVNNRWNKSTALFISFLFDKEVYYNEKIILYNKEKNGGVITV